MVGQPQIRPRKELKSVSLLSGFKAQTQFLLITHSKKTMTCASTLYGVTMQESGVSKPISVRFVDVGENGEILDTAMEEESREFSIDTPAKAA